MQPFSELLDVQWGGSVHRGGPSWPDWDDQVAARHCQRGTPIDDQPELAEPTSIIDRHIAWGGPITRHFGHQVADFSMRLLDTTDNLPGVAIAFASHPREGIDSIATAPAFFRDTLAWLGIAASDAFLIREPTVARGLSVAPQAEQIHGPGPSAAHLDRLDSLMGRRLLNREELTACTCLAQANTRGLRAKPSRGCAPSRRRHRDQAGNATAARSAGAYAGADRIIFAEGSAVHAVNLLGSSLGDVLIINRRAGRDLGIESLIPRARSVFYVEAVASLVHGLRPSAQPAIEAGLTMLDVETLMTALAGAVPRLADHLDRRAFLEAQANDALDWLGDERTISVASMPGSADFLIGTLRSAGLGHLSRQASELIGEPRQQGSLSRAWTARIDYGSRLGRRPWTTPNRM